MAIGRLSVGVGSKGKAGPHAMYIAREGKYAKHNDKIEKLEATGSGNMPDWAQADPNFFWKMSDDKERKNGTSYREHVIALPRELTPEQRHDLIKAWITQEIGEKHAYQYAIHNPLAMDGGEQPHAHIMFSERLIDGIDRDPDQYFMRHNPKNPEKGGSKKANVPQLAAERKEDLKAQRDRWENLCNSHLELAGSDARISMKSLEEQGIDREPINLSMQQIKRTDIQEIYTNLLTARDDFEQAKLDSLACNVFDELRIIDKELHERASGAIDRASRAIDGASESINFSQSIIERREPRIEWSSKKHQFYEQRIDSSTAGISFSTQITINTKRRIINSEQLVTNSSDQLNAITREFEKQRLAAETQKQLVQQAEKEAQERIEIRTAHQLLKLQLLVKVTEPSPYGNKPTLMKNAITPIGKNLYLLLKEANNKGYDININNKDYKGNFINQEIAQNPTAMAFERFMLCPEVLANPDIYNDFVVRLGIREFANKYGLTCNPEDIKQLDRLNPDPKLNVPSPQPERKTEPQATNNYDLGL